MFLYFFISRSRVVVFAVTALWAAGALAASPSTTEARPGSIIPTASPATEPTPIRLAPVTVYATNTTQAPFLDKPAPTASRLAIPVGEVPASIAVVDRPLMDQLGARNLLEAAQLAPGVTAAEPVSSPGLFSTRGFTGNDIIALFDGLPFGPPSMVAHPEDTWKYSRVEVLKGPASLLYGEGALAGAVNYVPKKPSVDRYEHEVFTSFGSFETSRLGLGSGGPIGETGLAYRLDFSRQSSGGFVDDTGHEYYDLAGSLRYDVTPQLVLTLSFDAMWQDFGSYWGTPVVNGRVESAVRDVNYNIVDNINAQDQQWLRLQADWQASEGVEVRNTLYGYMADRHWRNVERYTFQPANGLIRRSSPVEILHDQTIVGDRLDVIFTHEVLGLENRLLTSIEGYADTFQRDSNRPDNGFDFVDLFAPGRGTFTEVATMAATAERRTRTLNGALIVEDHFKPFEKLSFLGGFRAEVIRLDSENLRSDPSAEFDRTFTPVTGRIGAMVEALPCLNAYAMYGTAAKAPSTLVVLDETFRTFGLERGDMVEVGLKHSLWENRVEWTLALYQIWKNDIVTRDPADSSRNQQIGEQTSHGIELSLVAHPSKRWEIGGNLAVLDAQFEEFNIATGGRVVAYAGNTPPNVPEVVANAWTSYSLPWNISVGALVRYVGAAQANNANTLEMPDYVTLDLFSTYRYKSLEVGLRVRNVLDREYSAWSVGDGAQMLLGAPLSVEGSLTYRF